MNDQLWVQDAESILRMCKQVRKYDSIFAHVNFLF